jgi:hypothetical protein
MVLYIYHSLSYIISRSLNQRIAANSILVCDEIHTISDSRDVNIYRVHVDDMPRNPCSAFSKAIFLPWVTGETHNWRQYTYKLNTIFPDQSLFCFQPCPLALEAIIMHISIPHTQAGLARSQCKTHFALVYTVFIVRRDHISR